MASGQYSPLLLRLKCCREFWSLPDSLIPCTVPKGIQKRGILGAFVKVGGTKYLFWSIDIVSRKGSPSFTPKLGLSHGPTDTSIWDFPKLFE